MRSITTSLVLAVVLSACSSDGATDTTPATTSTTAGPTTTVTTTTTVPTTTTTTTVPDVTGPVTVWLLDESGSNGPRQGPFLYPIAGDPREGDSEAEAALGALLGTTELDTAIPAGTTVDAVSVDGTTAVVDLSEEFASGGGSTSVMARLAQVTFTLTSLDGIDAVLLVEDGEPVELFSAEGLVLDGLMVRGDFEDFLPGILVEEPAAGATVEVPFRISGVAAAFEGVFQLQVLAGSEVVFEPDFVMTDSGVGFGEFAIEADFPAEPGTPLTIRVWEFSARDGSVVSERFVPVTVAG